MLAGRKAVEEISAADLVAAQAAAEGDHADALLSTGDLDMSASLGDR